MSPRPSNATSEKPRHARGFSFVGAAIAIAEGDANPTMRFSASVLGVLFVAALVAMRHAASYTDELNHYAQIVLFRHGEFRVFTGT